MPEQSPFSTLEASFRLLCKGPSPLALDGREVGPPLPPRPIPLTELQSILRHPSTPLGVGDRAICAVVRRAQAYGGSWTVGLAGLLLPALRATVADVGRAWPDAVADLEAEMLAELVEQMQDCDTGSDRAARHLLWRVCCGPSCATS